MMVEWSWCYDSSEYVSGVILMLWFEWIWWWSDPDVTIRVNTIEKWSWCYDSSEHDWEVILMLWFEWTRLRSDPDVMIRVNTIEKWSWCYDSSEHDWELILMSRFSQDCQECVECKNHFGNIKHQKQPSHKRIQGLLLSLSYFLKVCTLLWDSS